MSLSSESKDNNFTLYLLQSRNSIRSNTAGTKSNRNGPVKTYTPGICSWWSPRCSIVREKIVSVLKQFNYKGNILQIGSG